MNGALFQPFPMLPRRRAQAWRHQRAFRRPRHFHAEPELNLITRGSARFGIGDDAVSVGAGDVLLFHPGQDHVLLEASDDLGLFAVALQPELAARACDNLVRLASRGCRFDTIELAHHEDELGAVTQGSCASDTELVLTKLFQRVTARSTNTHVLSRLTLEFVRADRERSGVELSDALRAQQSAVSRQFHRDLGLRFVEYRARVRLMAFIKLVDEGRALHHAALDAGFGSYAQCHRVFSNALGCSPRDYFAGLRAQVNGRFADAGAISGT